MPQGVKETLGIPENLDRGISRTINEMPGILSRRIELELTNVRQGL